MISDNKKYHFSDFTENGYKNILKKAKERFYFSEYGENVGSNNVALWRHDIDISVNRAFKMAKIEKEMGIKSTYFVHCHSFYYNFLEKGQSNLIKEISNMGHKIGLHFDPDYYNLGFEDIEQIKELAKLEQNLLETVLKVKINAISWHNPGKGRLLQCNNNLIANMVNAYGKDIFENYKYCSDSDGYWRFSRLIDFIMNPDNNKIQVLTHPGWWVEKPMSPYKRIMRSVEGRKVNSINSFLKQMKEMRRRVIK